MATENTEVMCDSYLKMYNEIREKYPVHALNNLYESLCCSDHLMIKDDGIAETLDCLSIDKEYAEYKMRGCSDALARIEFDRAMFNIHTLLISIPLEELPLLINDEDLITREIVKWRMRQGL